MKSGAYQGGRGQSKPKKNRPFLKGYVQNLENRSNFGTIGTKNSIFLETVQKSFSCMEPTNNNLMDCRFLSSCGWWWCLGGLDQAPLQSSEQSILTRIRFQMMKMIINVHAPCPIENTGVVPDDILMMCARMLGLCKIYQFLFRFEC